MDVIDVFCEFEFLTRITCNAAVVRVPAWSINTLEVGRGESATDF